MNDCELLEMAAKSVGYRLHVSQSAGNGILLDDLTFWSPLTDDGDAMRLAVKLRLQLIQMDSKSEDDGITTLTPVLHVDSTAGRIYQYLGDDPCAATRRAIVRAAAAIGAAL